MVGLMRGFTELLDQDRFEHWNPFMLGACCCSGLFSGSRWRMHVNHWDKQVSINM